MINQEGKERKYMKDNKRLKHRKETYNNNIRKDKDNTNNNIYDNNNEDIQLLYYNVMEHMNMVTEAVTERIYNNDIKRYKHRK